MLLDKNELKVESSTSGNRKTNNTSGKDYSKEGLMAKVTEESKVFNSKWIIWIGKGSCFTFYYASCLFIKCSRSKQVYWKRSSFIYVSSLILFLK